MLTASGSHFVALNVLNIYTYKKNSKNENPWPWVSAIPALTTLAEAPIKVPFPVNTKKGITAFWTNPKLDWPTKFQGHSK